MVRTLAAVSVFGSDPDLAVRRRLASPGAPGEVGRALADGRLMRTFSFRGSVQVMAPETAGAYLALRSAGRQWALKSWVDHYALPPDEWPDLREVVRGVVAAGPVAPQAVADELAGVARFAHLAREFAEPNHTFLKPFAWQGDIALGPDLDGPLVLQSPAAAPTWAGIRRSTRPGRSPSSTTSPPTDPPRPSTSTTGSAAASAPAAPGWRGGGRRWRTGSSSSTSRAIAGGSSPSTPTSSRPSGRRRRWCSSRARTTG